GSAVRSRGSAALINRTPGVESSQTKWVFDRPLRDAESMPVRGGMVVVRRTVIGISPQLIVLGDLLGAQDGACFEMGGKVHRPQSCLGLADRRRRGAQALGRDLAFRKQPIE